jgi:hypothetical protein
MLFIAHERRMEWCMFAIEKLLKEHEELLATVRMLVNELDQSNCFAKSRVGELRARVAALLKEHLTSEHEHLLSKLTPELRSQIPEYDRVMRNTQKLRFAYSAHIGKWTLAAAESDWPSYRLATKELLAQLVSHANFEEEHLYRPAARLKRAA